MVTFRTSLLSEILGLLTAHLPSEVRLDGRLQRRQQVGRGCLDLLCSLTFFTEGVKLDVIKVLGLFSHCPRLPFGEGLGHIELLDPTLHQVLHVHRPPHYRPSLPRRWRQRL